MTFFAKTLGSEAAPAVTTWSMFFVLAEANTSAGAPEVIWVARAELAAKLNVTLVPGWAASNCLPSSVKDSVSDAAANTVMSPESDGDGELVPVVGDVPAAEPVSSPDPQPDRPTASRPAATMTRGE